MAHDGPGVGAGRRTPSARVASALQDRLKKANARRWPQRSRPRGRDVVVLYHRIAREPPDPTGMVVDPDRLGRQLHALASQFDVVPALDVVRPSGRPQAAITFDDGYADNLHAAVPVLRELGLPASLFVVTDALWRDREFWWDRLDHLVLQDLPTGLASASLNRRQVQLDLTDDAARRGTLRRLGRLLVRQRPAAVERFVDELQARVGPEPAPCHRHARLTPDQVVTLADDPLFEIGSHTCTHSALSRLPRDDCRQELVDSRAALRELLGAPPRLLAYPYGAPGSVRRRDAGLAAQAGYDLAFANVAGSVEGASPYAVPRIAVGEWEPEELLRRTEQWTPP